MLISSACSSKGCVEKSFACTKRPLRGKTYAVNIQGKAILTGASGFIGGRLRDALLEKGVDVISIRRKGSPASKKGRSVEASYDDVQGLQSLMETEQPDYVFHVAGATKGVSYSDFQGANVMPTRNLLRAIEKGAPKLKRFVHFSSLACFGPSTRARPLLETDPRNPIEHYGKSKLEAEYVVEASKDIPWSIIRPCGVYGPGDVDYFNLFREVSKGRNVFFGNRDRWMSAVYVDDLVDATLLAATHDNAVNKGYFIADGKPITWGTFQQAIVDVSGRRVMTLNLPEFFVTAAAYAGEAATKVDNKPRLFNRQKAIMGAQEAWTCSAASIEADLGFKAKVEVREGCKRAMDWYRAEKWL
jgi:nucleoside-diphosphate-sugar epimerase